MGVEKKFYVKKNLAQKRIEKVITYLGTDYLLPIEEILNWNITSEQKMIGKYKSQKQKQIMEEETGLLGLLQNYLLQMVHIFSVVYLD